MLRALLLLVSFVAIAAACPAKRDHDAAPAARAVSLIVSADLWGYLAPCGCSPDMRGGIDRAAAYIKAERAKGPLIFVDAGDALFDALTYPPAEEVQAKRRAQAVAEALRAMGLAVKARFERDDVLPGVFDAYVPAKLVLRGPKVVREGGIAIGFVPIELDETAADRAREGAARARREGAELVVGIVHGGRERVLAFGGAARAAGLDVLVGAHIDTELAGETSRAVLAELPIFFTQARGQSLLHLELTLRPRGTTLQIAGNEAQRAAEISSIEERLQTYAARVDAMPPSADRAPFEAKIAELTQRRRRLVEEPVAPPASGNVLAYRFVPITQDRPSDPEVRAIVAAYDRDVAAKNLAFAKTHGVDCPPPEAGEAAYVGAARCASCHPAAQKFWATTKHALAFETLEAVHKQYDLSCIGCHVTGWQAPGGVCRVDKTEGREDVTCESCHGPGSLHVAKPTKETIRREVSEQQCRSCHTAENSTGFDHETYRRRIVGPGHGATAQAPK